SPGRTSGWRRNWRCCATSSNASARGTCGRINSGRADAVSRSLPQHLLLLANAALLVASQLLLKTGLKKGGGISLTSLAPLGGLIHQILTTPALIGGVCLGGASTLLWILVLSRFELSYA